MKGGSKLDACSPNIAQRHAKDEAVAPSHQFPTAVSSPHHVAKGTLSRSLFSINTEFMTGCFSEEGGVKGLSPLLQTNEVVRERYRVIQQINGGGFGQIFL